MENVEIKQLRKELEEIKGKVAGRLKARELSIGSGNQVMHATREACYFGGRTEADANLILYYNGKIKVGTSIASEINGSSLVAGSVDTDQLADGAVESDKINIISINPVDGSINENMVDTAQLVDGAITSAKTDIASINPVDGEINSNKIGTTQLQDDAITTAKVADGAIQAKQITTANFVVSEGTFSSDSPSAGSVSWADIKVIYEGNEYSITDNNTSFYYIYWQLTSPTIFQSSDTLPNLGNDDYLVAWNDSGTYRLVWNSTRIDGNRITSGSVTASQIASNTITANQIASNTITASEIVAETITSNELATGSVTANKIVAGSVTTDKIASNAITTVKLAADAVTANNIAAGAVTALKISVDNLSAINANMGTITAGSIIGGTITTSTSSYPRIYLDSQLFLVQPSSGVNRFVISTVNDYGYSAGDVIIGAINANHCQWDNSAGTFFIRGELETNSSSYRLKLEPTNRRLGIYSGTTLIGSMFTDADTDLKIKSEDDLVFISGSTHEIRFRPANVHKITINTDGDIDPITASQDLGNATNYWNDVYAERYYHHGDGGSTADIDLSKSTATLSFKGGILTSIS